MYAEEGTGKWVVISLNKGDLGVDNVHTPLWPGKAAAIDVSSPVERTEVRIFDANSQSHVVLSIPTHEVV